MPYNTDATEVLDELYVHLCQKAFPFMHSSDAKRIIDAMQEFGLFFNPNWNIGDSN